MGTCKPKYVCLFWNNTEQHSGYCEFGDRSSVLILDLVSPQEAFSHNDVVVLPVSFPLDI